MIGSILAFALGLTIGWLCAFFLWPASLYARMLAIFPGVAK